MKELQKKINRSKLHLMTQRQTTFFSSLIANLKIVFTEDVPTAATDGIHMFFNPQFIEPLDNQEMIGLMLHEAMHSVYEHMSRQTVGKLDKQVWNIAGDYVINNDLDKRGYKLPKEGLIDHKYDGKGTKEIYDILIAEMVEVPPTMMLDLIFDPPEGMSKEEHQERVISNVVKAVTQAQLANDPGSIPGEVARQVEKLIDPKLPWHQILQNYMSAYAKEEYTWARPNKRFWPDFYLPSMHSEALNQITVAIDVSGSIMQEDLDAFMAEVRYVFEILKPKKMRILGFDTKIHDDLEFVDGDALEDVSLTGGGGTNCRPVIQTLKKDEPEIALIMSDGEFSMPSFAGISSDVFWIIKGNESWTTPYGQVIYYDE